MKICPHCNSEFFGQGRAFGAHLTNCEMNPKKDLIRKKISIAKSVPRNEYTFYCKRCGNSYNVILTESEFKRGAYRIYCSDNCSHRKREEKRCLICNKIIKYKDDYCLKCGKEYRYNSYIKDWKEGKVTGLAWKYSISHYIRQYLFKKYDNRCCQCGWDKINLKTGKIPLTVHHKDGNYKNNIEENLELLCPNCHSLTETYCSLNIGNGRNKSKNI